MNLLFMGLLLAAASPSAIEIPAGTELQYTGSLSQKTKAGASEAKSFSIYALTIAGEDGTTQLA
ncbi:MAG: hypothetical protein H7062_05630, partial [Candidatus Saccharimonas sp.]|nr:hypothetical protein [Planctomycetaceae bacterium]